MEARDDSFKPNQDWNNHAWGAAPANIISGWRCGIRPASPGFETFTIDPHSAGFDDVKCLAPTPHGAIEFVYETGRCSIKRE